MRSLVRTQLSPPKNSENSFSEFFYPSRSRGSPKRACRALGVPVGLVYHRRAKCGVYHQPLWGCISSRVSVHLPAAWWYTATSCGWYAKLRFDDIQGFALIPYTPLAWFVKLHFILRIHVGATILHPNTKVLDFQGLFVFLRAKNTPHSPLHLFPELMDLNLWLWLLNCFVFYDIIYVKGVRGNEEL